MPDRPSPRPPGPGEGVNALVILGLIFIGLNQFVFHWVDFGALFARSATSSSAAPTTDLAPLVAAMDRLDAQQLPYCFGGGHGGTPAVPSSGVYCWHTGPERKVYGSGDRGFDCSSAVSWVLQEAGYDHRTMDTLGFTNWGEPGGGQHATLWVTPGRGGLDGHVFLQIDDRYWGTDASNPRHGPGWHPPRSTNGFVPRHLPGW